MGHNESEERQLSTDIMQHTLKKRGIKVNISQLIVSLPFVQQCSPWFPDQGTLDLKIRDRVGKDIQVWDQKNRPQNMLTEPFSYRNILRQALDINKPQEIGTSPFPYGGPCLTHVSYPILFM